MKLAIPQLSVATGAVQVGVHAAFGANSIFAGQPDIVGFTLSSSVIVWKQTLVKPVPEPVAVHVLLICC